MNPEPSPALQADPKGSESVTSVGLDDVDCPCCTGLTEAAWEDLCDDCLAAWLASDWGHDCDRPAEARRA